MSWQAERFREHFLARLGDSDQAFHHATLLRRMDRQWGGLDKKIADVGLGQIMAWARTLRTGLFADRNTAAQCRAALNCYVKYLIDEGDPDAAHPIMIDPPIKGTPGDHHGLIRHESALQVAVRRDLSVLEPGLVAIDGGIEHLVPSGRIDILARDSEGRQVVIELKAGTCPGDAIEQALGYTDDIARLSAQPCRTIIVAASFSDRTRAAARRIPGLQLVEYRLRLRFEMVE